ncbi:MAG TPA: aminotransferase class V-fold PLP-dependent enzyme [Candidatus Kapabacteria bacterium]|nr:aminotransferase class V-fold PLP-dependent enzyme [Candidatus Kapabacteria bacterium]
MTVAEARRQFPHTWTDMIYLNHAAISPMSFRVREAVANYMERRSLKDIESFPMAPRMANQVKVMLANRLGTTADRLAFVLNTSEGLSLLTEGLQWNQGDRIALYRYEFPTNVYPFLNQQRKGVVVDLLEPADAKMTVEFLRTAIKPGTKLLSLSAVQFLYAYRADLEAIGAFCKEQNIIFCVDAIQAFPYLPIDVERSQIDFLSCGAHKWLLAPEGVAFIYVSKEMQSLIHQSSMGWTTVKNAMNPFDFDLDRIRDDASRYENGTMNYPAIAGLKASLEFIEEFGYKEAERRTVMLSGMIVDECYKHGVDVLTSSNPVERGGIAAINIDKAESVFERLEKASITAALRAAKIRFSPYFYTTEEEIKKAMSVLFE